MLSPILTLFALISKPLWLNIRSTGAEAETETRGFQDQDQDQDFDVQDQDRDSRLTRPILEVHDWDGL